MKYPYLAEYPTAAIGSLGGVTMPSVVKEKILSFSKLYNKPVKPVVEIYDKDFQIQHTFDPFMHPFQEPSININHVEVARVQDAASSFIVKFFDHKNEIDKSKVTNGSWVIIRCGRDPTKLKSLIWGRVSNNPFERGRLDPTYFELQGESTLVIPANTMIRYTKTSELSDILNGTVNPNDENSFAYTIVEDILTDPTITLVGDRSIADRARLDMSAFEHEVSDSITTWTVPLSDGLTPIRDLAEMTGSYFFIDGDNRPHFTYGNSNHSGIRLKQYIESDWTSGFDLGDKTSYFHGTWTGNKITSKTSGFANILVSQSGKLRQAVSFSEGTNNSYNLFNKDLAQKIEVDNKFVDIVIWLTKSGAGSPSRGKVHGHIVADNNGLPTGAKIATFDIKLALIPEGNTPKPFFISNILQTTGIVSNNESVWIVMYEIGDSDDRTVNLWHNAKFDAAISPSAVRPLPSGRKDDKPHHSANSGWQLINSGNGPTFAFSALEVLDMDFVAVDSLSTSLYGEYEAQFDVPWANDLLTTIKAMNAALFESSRPKMEYNMNEVFIPLDYYFDPVDIITLEDTMSGHTKQRSITARVSQANMIWDANTITTGIHFMSILPTGFWSPLYDILQSNYNPCEA